MDSLINIPFVEYPRKYLGVDFVSEYFSLAEDNEFIPIHCLKSGELLTKGNEKSFLYSLNVGINYRAVRKIPTFCNLIREGFGNLTEDRWTKITHVMITRDYRVHSGMLVTIDDDFKITPLIAMCVRRDFLYKIAPSNPDYTNFCLVIDRKLEGDDHIGIYRNMNRHYIKLVEKQVDVIYTNDLTRLCFNGKSLAAPKFKTIAEMIVHTKSMNEVLRGSLQREPNG